MTRSNDPRGGRQPHAIRPGYWFAPKRYGFGAVPVTIAGWVATAVYLIVLLIVVGSMRTEIERAIMGVCITIGFIAIVWRKTDGGFAWRWRGSE